MTGDSRQITADDVARRAGVSRWTVTRAFKPGAPISDKRRKAVLRAAQELGYVPDLLASGLAASRSGLVALLIDDFENAHKLPVLSALTEALQETGRAAILVNTSRTDTPANALIHARQRRVDASVLIGSRIGDDILQACLAPERPERLIVFARESTVAGIVSISCDDDRAMREISAHAIAQGHRKTLYVAGPRTGATRLRRSDAFAREMAAAGLPRPGILHIGSYSQSAAMREMSAYFETAEALPDLLFCENDALAFGAIDAAGAHGLSVPGDLAVIGFDNLSLGASRSYHLTSYEQPLEMMAARLIEVLDGAWPDAPGHFLPGRLVIRRSSQGR